MADVCSRCGQEKSVSDVRVPPPQEGGAASEARLCSTCASKVGAKPIRASFGHETEARPRSRRK